GVDFHYGRDDFKDDSRLVRTLSRERTKDMAGDYDRRDSAQQFAERRGITFGERVAEIVRPVVEKARGIFDGLRLSLPGQDRAVLPAPEPGRGMFDGLDLDRFASAPVHDPARQRQREHDPQPMRAGGLRGAVERYAKAVDAIRQTHAQGIDAMPHQREALDKARDALDAIRPEGSTDLNSAFRAGPELIREAAEGRGHEAVRAMQAEAEIRIDPFQRADRFVEGWQQLQRQHQELVRDGNFRAAKTTA
ncbi:hypothetical protein LTR94_029593, partial [Friedmanniomyces endolithicus]